MRVIYKYPLKQSAVHAQEVSMPRGALIVHCAMQHGLPTMWAEVRSEETAHHMRTFLIYGTGERIDGRFYRYVGTIIDGAYVWHIYEKRVRGPARKN